MLAVRVAEEQQEQQPQAAGEGEQEVSIEQMNLMVPGLIEQVEV